MADSPQGDFACCAPAGRPAGANVPLVIVNPARGFSLEIYDDTAELICPLCTDTGGCLPIVEPANLGQLVDLALGHIAEAHPEHLVPAPVVLGPASDFVPSRVVNVGDTVKWGHLARVPDEALHPGGSHRSDSLAASSAAIVAGLRARRDASPAGVCTGCGCTNDDCSQCIARTGHPCSWVTPTLCSACT